MTDTIPLSIRGIDHVVIRACQLQAMLDFYQDVLGCVVERHVEDLGLYQLRAGSALIDLIDVEGKLGAMGGKPPGDEGQNMDHLCLQVEGRDMEALKTYLSQNEINAGETARRYGSEGYGPSIYIKDPDGNTVELKGPAEPNQSH